MAAASIGWDLQSPSRIFVTNADKVQLWVFCAQIGSSMSSFPEPAIGSHMETHVIELLCSEGLIILMAISIWAHRKVYQDQWAHAWWRAANNAVTLAVMVATLFVVRQAWVKWLGPYVELSRRLILYNTVDSGYDAAAVGAGGEGDCQLVGVGHVELVEGRWRRRWLRWVRLPAVERVVGEIMSSLAMVATGGSPSEW
ncbi:MAG: hypothetical protein LQ343_005566 [Gyalolechia ehrenbergii]|nr:MAG: hypothetical protein LQ343_005566 [Gyalolechia ehrenbergii]